MVRQALDMGHVITAITRPGSRSALPVHDRLFYAPSTPEGIALAMANASVVVHLATCYGRIGDCVDAMVDANLRLPILLADVAGRHGVPILLGDSFFSAPGVDYNHLKSYVGMKRACATAVHGVVAGRVQVAQLAFEHLYGPGDDPNKAIPSLLAKLIHGSSRLPLTSGTQTRDFTYVEDAAAAVLAIARHIDKLPCGSCERLGIGTGSSMTLRDFIETAYVLAGSQIELGWGDLPMRAGEPNSQGADRRFLDSIGCESRFHVQDALRMTLNEISEIMGKPIQRMDQSRISVYRARDIE